MNILKAHENNEDLCRIVCIVLLNIGEANHRNQIDICEKGGLDALIRILKKYHGAPQLISACFCAIAMNLSSQETHAKFCTPEVLGAVKERYEKFEASGGAEHFYFTVTREEDPRVKEAVSKGICTNKLLKCDSNCRYEEDNYCFKCCAQQKVFRCHTCDKDVYKVNYYCETCHRKNHNGHNCEEFFYPVKCATK